MIKSMTGFGRATLATNGNSLTVEIRSLNSKFLELNLRLPSVFSPAEMLIRTQLTKTLERGKVDVNISLGNATDDGLAHINTDAIKHYLNQLKKISGNTTDTAQYLPQLLTLPQVISAPKTVADDKQIKQLDKVLKEALTAFNSFRVQEGQQLEKEFKQQLKTFEKHIKQIEKIEPERIKNIRGKLQQALAELSVKAVADTGRLEQELIFYIEKLDVSEEKFRLRSHCRYFAEVLESNDANGKKLGFIIQEMGREINTLGSKANHATIQRHVVEMKDELEKMKEQIANVL
ncbi:MAG: YicC family protein [Bacteroidia bacterium]|nr:YicC family protein [Bacteroidia bacterium]